MEMLNWMCGILIQAELFEINWNFAPVKTARFGLGLREVLLWANGSGKEGGGVEKGKRMEQEFTLSDVGAALSCCFLQS